MKKAIVILITALASFSCSKVVMDPLRLDIPGTFWSYSAQDQTARVTFPDGKHASVLQIDFGNKACVAQHGTYSIDGHRVILEGEGWPNEIKFVRTFSHLKNNSTNKNLTPLKPVAHKSLAGSIWTTTLDDNLHITFFDHDGTCVEANYANAIRKEGPKYGWDFGRKDYTLDGQNLMVGTGKKITLFEDFMIVDTLAVLRTAPSVENPGASVMSGTIWTYDVNSYPGLVIFTSGSTFTRIMTGLNSGRLIYTFLNGTYQLSGTTLTMTEGEDINETCQLSADRFTFLDRPFRKITLP